jgi:hypothetical protein
VEGRKEEDADPNRCRLGAVKSSDINRHCVVSDMCQS